MSTLDPAPGTPTAELVEPRAAGEREAPELLMDFVARWAERTPDEQAVTYRDRDWTWAQWAQRIRRAAGGLLAAGISRGDRIAFLDKNHPACLELAFAAASIGAALVIVNWRLAADELGYLLTDSGARMLFVGTEFLELAHAALIQSPDVEQLIVVDADPAADTIDYEMFLADSQPPATAAPVAETDTALVIYSSGTTGHPKGVVLSQRALVAHTVNARAGFPFRAGDKNLVAMPLFHVGGVCYAFVGIRAGVPSLMTREPDAASLLGGFAAGATHTFFVPPVIAGLLAAGEPAAAAVSGLRYLGYGAAPTALPLLRRALAAWPELNFVQVYGQTELAGAATFLMPADHRDPAAPQLLLSAGKPLPGTEMRIVDAGTGEELPTGERGEIWFRTAQAMTGYLNRPESTAAAVTPDRWVRTGDLGRVDKNGYLYIEDRIKDLIISGGENVYGAEVERVLMDHPAIADAAVIGVPDERWGESVKAVVVTTGATESDIIAFCRDHLAGYKCPRTVDFVDLIPRNASGKILKRELRAPYWRDRDRAV
jgi:acyl-CoA synthetase (AMP-forming)/AMP-acid ligase II